MLDGAWESQANTLSRLGVAWRFRSTGFLSRPLQGSSALRYSAGAGGIETNSFDSTIVNQLPDKVLLTRRRWDTYMFPTFIAAAAIGLVRANQTGQMAFVLMPIAVIPIWLMLRLRTPRDGMAVTTIRSTPGAIVMLWFALATLLSMTALLVIDIHVFGHPFRAPLEPYHALLFAPPFIIMFTGAFFADRIKKQHKMANSIDQDGVHEEPSTNNPMNPSGGSGVS